MVVCCFLFTSLLGNMLLNVWLRLRQRQRWMKYTEVQSSGRWLWASVSLSHPAFASPAARVCFSVTAHISFSSLPRVNGPDKKLDYWRAFFWLDTIQRVILSCLSLVYSIFSHSSDDLSAPMSTPWAKLGEPVLVNGWHAGGRTNRKHLSAIIRTEENRTIHVAFFLKGGLMCPSHNSALSALMAWGTCHIHVRVWGGTSQRAMLGVGIGTVKKCVIAQSHNICYSSLGAMQLA